MIKYEFKGYVPTCEILDYYTRNHPDCFITLSATEGGAPVSIAEAMGCGIPIIATKVGGVPEMVDENGILLAENPTVEQIADAIVEIATASENKRRVMRTASRKKWEKDFDCKKNAFLFSEQIIGLNSNSKCGKNKVNKIVLITDGYPYGGEQSFVEPELTELLRHFDVEIICPVSDEQYKRNYVLAEESICRIKEELSRDIHHLNIVRVDNTWSILRNVFGMLLYFFDKRNREEQWIIWRSKTKRLVRYWESMKYYARARKFGNGILGDILDKSEPSHTIVYTYWHTFRTLAACMIKGRYNGLRVLTREHGYDLYDERMERSGRQPYRETMDKCLDSIVFACEKGREYYLNRNHFEKNNKKYIVSYIGSTGPGCDIGRQESDIFRIVSCSNLIPLKRVEMIIDGLGLASAKLPNKRIEWIHFGEGFLQNDLKEYAKSKL